MSNGWKWVMGIAGLVALLVVCNALANSVEPTRESEMASAAASGVVVA